jgi:hypothetical protein
VGLATEVRERLKVEWVDTNNPEKVCVKSYRFLFFECCDRMLCVMVMSGRVAWLTAFCDVSSLLEDILECAFLWMPFVRVSITYTWTMRITQL